MEFDVHIISLRRPVRDILRLDRSYFAPLAKIMLASLASPRTMSASLIHGWNIAMLKHLLAIAAVLGASLAATASEFGTGTIKIISPWAPATPDRAKVGGGFMVLTNTGQEDDRLIGGSSEISKSVQVHEMHIVNGVMMMRHAHPGIHIKAGSSVTLKPFSHHLMFMDLKQPLIAGQTIKGTLLFEKVGKVEIEYEVLPLGARGPDEKSKQ